MTSIPQNCLYCVALESGDLAHKVHNVPTLNLAIPDHILSLERGLNLASLRQLGYVLCVGNFVHQTKNATSTRDTCGQRAASNIGWMG